MMTTDNAGGVFFVISILSLIFGGLTIAFEEKLESREIKPQLESSQNSSSNSFIASGVTGSVAIGLSIAGRSKKQGEDKLNS